MITKAIYSRLANYAGLTALVGTKVYSIKVPQGTALPYVVVQTISRRRVSAMGDDIGHVESRVQVSTFADKYDNASTGAKQIAAQVRAALQRFSGTVESVVISDIYLEGESDLYDPEPETGVYHIPLDCMVWYQE